MSWLGLAWPAVIGSIIWYSDIEMSPLMIPVMWSDHTTPHHTTPHHTPPTTPRQTTDVDNTSNIQPLTDPTDVHTSHFKLRY